ncbi:MAG: hypothetical protein GXY85_02625 [Candidatus Brocadiaceae bacterium]|nr:hypothetical protein [Candidatus Brocadiaceae bacterium]
MDGHRRAGRAALAAALALVLALSQGCTYLRHRGEDLLDLGDFGVTLSIKPGLALYANGVSVSPGGLSYVDGYFLGLGGGRLGFTRHYQRCWGLFVLGHETHAWGDFNKGDPTTLNRQYVGVLGLPTFAILQSRPAYMPSCIHYLHVGFFGVVANARYMEMLDFMLGWAYIDLARDDGRTMSRWPWRGDY